VERFPEDSLNLRFIDGDKGAGVGVMGVLGDPNGMGLKAQEI
jgi:hypothetical protein